MTIKFETYPARRYIIAGKMGDEIRYLTYEHGARWQSKHVWGPHLDDAILYETIPGAVEALRKIETGHKYRPAPIEVMQVREVRIVVGERIRGAIW